MSEFTDRTVLVTGSSRGIGRAIATAFATAGAEVIVTASTDDGARRAADEIGTGGGRVKGFGFDLASESQTRDAVEKIKAGCGTISVLVNNAGVTRDGLLLRMREGDWKQVLETNLTAVYRLCRAFVPTMVRARSGRIVNITSVVARTGNPGQSNYAAAKAGVEGFTRSLAREVASRNITVNTVAPGFIDTDMTRDIPDKARARLLEQIPMNRLGSPDDVAAAVLFLASADAGYITGTTLDVNGGMSM